MCSGIIKSQIKVSRVALQSQEPFIKGINRRGVTFHVLLNLLHLAIDVVNFAIYFFTFFGKRILFFFFEIPDSITSFEETLALSEFNSLNFSSCALLMAFTLFWSEPSVTRTNVSKSLVLRLSYSLLSCSYF